jgi:hypothetical protein
MQLGLTAWRPPRLARDVIRISLAGVNRGQVTDNPRPERRKEHHEMHVDRRKSAIDVMEHVVLGVRPDQLRPASRNRSPRSRLRE